MEEPFLWNLMCQVVMALDFCHNRVSKGGEKRPIIHRDLKPENVFLTEDNMVKVCLYFLCTPITPGVNERK